MTKNLCPESVRAYCHHLARPRRHPPSKSHGNSLSNPLRPVISLCTGFYSLRIQMRPSSLNEPLRIWHLNPPLSKWKRQLRPRHLDPEDGACYHSGVLPVRVAELFAGVGGFRIGLEAANRDLGFDLYQVVWNNQWEPSTKVQHASDVYIRNFGTEGHSNNDISTVPLSDIPDVDLLVAGFPCQDYSVATSLRRAGGLIGDKGVLWWEIYRLLDGKKQKPSVVLLENVDRLLKSPVKRRGRDFAVMLASLANLGYSTEWRVINAADYGMPQRRRRVFILGYLEGTQLHRSLLKRATCIDWLTTHGVFSQAFPVDLEPKAEPHRFTIEGSLEGLTQHFNAEGGPTSFLSSGFAIGRKVVTARLSPRYEGKRTTLGDILVPEAEVPEEYFIDDNLRKWVYLKGPKVIHRISRTTGQPYRYSEGRMVFPDPIDKPSRTIVTGEGGRGPSRFKHVVTTPSGRYRRLLPVELERLNMFPDSHTEGPPASRRAFLMGNSLVTGIVHRAAVVLSRFDLRPLEPSITDDQRLNRQFLKDSTYREAGAAD